MTHTQPSDYFPIHAHSSFSSIDGMGTVTEMVNRVAELEQPGMALTDHGNMAGALSLYKECNRAGITPFPGSEFYMVADHTEKELREKRYHLILLALSNKGFKDLVYISSLTHRRDRFHRKPLLSLVDLQQLQAEGRLTDIAATTGCFFGLVQQNLVLKGYQSAKSSAELLAGLFPNMYVELQNHHIEDDGHSDNEICFQMIQIADELGLPVVAGQDSHYICHGDQPVHDMMKEICYFGDTDDYKFPGDGFHLAPVEWMQGHHVGYWDKIEEGHELLLDTNTIDLAALNKYQFHVPTVAKHADSTLRKRAMRRLGDMTEGLFDNYQKRMKEELAVIEKMGMANYFLLVADLVEWADRQGIITSTRGSANGSLLCYALGITDVDPIQWNTSFARFLSLDRVKPPDIDLDVETHRRHEVLDRVWEIFPDAVQLGTWLKMGISEQRDEMSGEGEDKGSIWVKYFAAQRRKGITEESIPNEHRRLLYGLADQTVTSGPGTHAAAMVLPGDNLRIDDYLATMLVGGATTCTQAPMEDVEEAGYMKLDILGLRSLSTINTCLGMIGKNATDIPWDDKRACSVLRSGKPTGVFQFEGYSTAKGGKEMKVASTHDAILCLALYRPAMMNSGMTERYLENRDEKITPSLHPVFDSVLADTHGVPVFQEQTMEIMVRAGLSVADWNEVMKAVKASNDKIDQYARAIFHRIKPKFLKACEARGIERATAKDAWQMVEDFTDYGFNRGHATGYGIMAYRMAWLKAHYPLEFMAALLDTWIGTSKEKDYISAARAMNIPIIKADVNHSSWTWTIDRDRNGIRRGLSSIKGVGEKAGMAIYSELTEGGPFDSIDDFIDRVPARPVSGGKNYRLDGLFNGVMEKLYNANALRSLGTVPND